MKDIKMVKCLQECDLLIKTISEIIEAKIEEKRSVSWCSIRYVKC